MYGIAAKPKIQRTALTRSMANRIARGQQPTHYGNPNGAPMAQNGAPVTGMNAGRHQSCGPTDPFARQEASVAFETHRPPNYGLGSYEYQQQSYNGYYCPDNIPPSAPPGAGMGEANPFMAVRVTPTIGAIPGAFQNVLAYAAVTVDDTGAGTAYPLATNSVPQEILGSVYRKEIRQLYVDLSLTGTGVPGAEPAFSMLVAGLLVFRIVQGSRTVAEFRLSQLLPQSGYDRWGISVQIRPIESDMTQTRFEIESDVNLPPALATLTYDVLISLNLLWL